MRTEQRIWNIKHGWVPSVEDCNLNNAQLVMVFGQRGLLLNKELFTQIKSAYPSAHFCGCSTAGEIIGTWVMDESVVMTAIEFEHSRVEGIQIDLQAVKDSQEAGSLLAASLPHEDLVHVFVLSDGLHVNGSELARGLSQKLPAGVTVTGGLAADGDAFEDTVVFFDTLPASNVVAAIGFYGTGLKIGHGSMGGWDPFGPERVITRSEGNILYEMDGHSALELYKRYLGEHAQGLPATGLLFPLSIRPANGANSVVRTILSVNENDQSLTFAGDVPEGSLARLMKANNDRLIDGAITAAEKSLQGNCTDSPELAVLISCVGRKLVLKQRSEEEVEGVQEIVGPSTVITGFYSYGEICPFHFNEESALHNQTMTITIFREV